MLVGQCADCRPLPDGVLARGYVTTTGQVFHNDPKCEFLLEGQRRFLGGGTTLPAPQRIGWVDAQARGLGRCLGCCTPQWLTRHSKEKSPPALNPGANSKPCFVLVDGQWHAGHLVWLRQDDNGLWWAEVTYFVDGHPVVVTKSQRFVAARQQDASQPRNA
jgi:hypothetical protein